MAHLAQRRSLYAEYRREFVDTFADAQRARAAAAEAAVVVAAEEAAACDGDSGAAEPSTPAVAARRAPSPFVPPSSPRSLTMRAESGLTQGEDGRWVYDDPDAELADEIRRDTERTHPTLAFFKRPAMLEALEVVLFVYAKLNPGVRYVQGMNEVLAPILFVLATDPDARWAAHAEADAFFCFTALMAELRDHFIQDLDNAVGGLASRIEQLRALHARVDPPLAALLAAQEMHFGLFALRWITTLLSREFELPDTVRLWDTLLADPRRFGLVPYVRYSLLAID